MDINEQLGQLQELTDEQVSELESQILSDFEATESQDLSPQSVDALESLASAVEAVRSEQARRVAQHEELTAKAAEASARVRGEAEGETETPEGEVPGASDEAAVGRAIQPGETDEGAPPDQPADVSGDPVATPGTADDEARKRRLKAQQPSPPGAVPPAATASNDTVDQAETTTSEPAAAAPVVATEEPAPVAASAETPAEQPLPADPGPESAVSETPEEAAQESVPEADPTQAPAPEAESVTPATSEGSTEQTTTAETPTGSEAAGESEVTSAEATAEANATAQTPEETVTTQVASGTEASPELEAPADRLPQPKTATNVAITAGADIPGISAGTKFDTMDQVAEAMVKRLHSIRHVNGGDGEQHIVASLGFEFPEDRILEANDPQRNTDKIMDVAGPDALTAAAGICLPLETRYDMHCDIGVTDRPIRDSLARFGADRGGIRFFNAPVLEDMSGATGFWRGDTNGQNWHTYGPDATTATSPANQKPCLEVQCTSEETAYIEAVTLCLTFNNLTTRTFPELIKRHNELALVAHARIAENHLLAQLEAGSTTVTIGSTVLGAAPELFNLLGRAIAAYRHKHRMNGVSPLRMLAPMWLMDLLRADLALRMPGDGLENTFGIAEAQINAWLRARNVNITWHLDGVGPTQDNNSFDFPTTVEFGLWAEGTWLYLDGGTLDLGLIRDSSLVATNQYKQFVETFEGLANMGCDSYWVVAPFEACGSAAALVQTCS